MSEEQKDNPPEDMAVPVPTITNRITANGLVEDIRGYEQIADEAVARDKRLKLASKASEEVKLKLRSLVGERRVARSAAGQPQPAGVFFHGTSPGHCVEVVESARRKALPPIMVQRALALGLNHLTVEEHTVELSGAMVKWFTDLFGDKNVPGASHSTRRVLAEEFEAHRERRHQELATPPEELALLEELGTQGLYAPAVEVKKVG